MAHFRGNRSTFGAPRYQPPWTHAEDSRRQGLDQYCVFKRKARLIHDLARLFDHGRGAGVECALVTEFARQGAHSMTLSHKQEDKLDRSFACAKVEKLKMRLEGVTGGCWSANRKSKCIWN
jgi:hypothetical protein